MKNKNIINSLKNACNGIIYVFKNEINFKIELVIGFFVVLSIFFFEYTNTEIAVLIIMIVSVLTAEIFNTAIEKVVDLYCKDEFYELAKIVKDTSAGAVLLISIASLFVGFFIIIKKFL